MGGWDDIHWVTTSADIPANDFLNYTPEEIRDKYPKIQLKDIVLERHIRFPRKYPIPPEYREASPGHLRTPLIRSLRDLRDSVFEDLSEDEIQGQYGRFTLAEVRREKARREAFKGWKLVQANLRNPGTRPPGRILGDVRRAQAILAGIAPLEGDLAELSERLGDIEKNLASRAEKP
jgi:hypothetical protein